MKYSTLRFLCAIGWGTLGLEMSVMAMWAFTQLPVWDVVFRGLAIYFVVMTFIFFVTEPPKTKAKAKKPELKVVEKPARKPVEKPVEKLVEKPIEREVHKPGKLRIYNVKEAKWDVYDR